jgi:uncharacterized protein YjgD (DUF1641 family)
MSKKGESISVRVDENFLKEIDEKVAEAQITRSEYLRLCLHGKNVKILAQGKDIAKKFFEMMNEKQNEEMMERMDEICALLNSLISELKREEA